VALRMYSLPPYKDINDPLRDLTRVAEEREHPLALLTDHLHRALKKLRSVGATLQSATQDEIFWRGMKDLEVTETFSVEGGTELAPMSSTNSFETALWYALSKRSLIFVIHTRNKLQRGVDIS